MTSAPLILRLPPRWARGGWPLRRLLGASGPGLVAELPAFAMSRPERAFARRLLRARPNLWLYRTHQRASCGDFVVVDMSGARPAARMAWVVELKQGERLRRRRRAAGQFAGAPRALARLADRDVASGRNELILGSPEAIEGLLVA